jgi:hypothetical protein
MCGIVEVALASKMTLMKSPHVFTLGSCLLFGLVVIGVSGVAAEQPAAVDFSAIGPKVGSVAADFSGTDQNGVARSLKTTAGPKGTMLVFFRSADW